MTIDDRHITEALHRNAEDGLRLLMGKYKEAVYWHIRRLVVAHADAQDAAQETFVRIYRSADHIRDGHSLRAWVFRIATNEALRAIEARKRHAAEGDETQADLIPDDGYVDYSDLEAVRLQKAILSLPEKQRITFNLRYYDELDYAEIAQATASTPSAAKANYHTAKEKIIAYMRSHD